ncbi:MAG: ABC transporter ATP-binding protein, partial [Chloroflexota bacterium]|nr:ABC transporter ATP-binding protein [Chloroflexota bacterium]
MDEPIVRIEHIRKEFAYLNPGPNSSEDDMWVSYLLGLIGRRKGQFAATRKQIVALDDVNLAVQPGEFFGLLGPNGAGKTTLIKVLATILQPNAGRIVVNGHDTVRDSARARASLSVAAASGWLAFDMQLTLAQNLVFWARLCGLDRQASLERAHHALDVVNLGEWRDEPPNHLSSGMRQRLAIAKGLLVRSPVFVLDEPTANVDPLIAYQIRDFLRNDLNRDLGQTIMLATHNMAEAEQLCDRVAIADGGKALACDPPGRLVRHLEGRIVEVALANGAALALEQLRTAGVAVQIADTLDGA